MLVLIDADFPKMELDKNHKQLETGCNYEQRSLTTGILANANVAITEAVGLVSAGSRGLLQWFTFHQRLQQPTDCRVLLGQTLTLKPLFRRKKTTTTKKTSSSNLAGSSLSTRDWK